MSTNDYDNQYRTYPDHVVGETKTCPFCKSVKNYQRLATHWDRSTTCSGPSTEEFPFDLFAAALLGNGYFDSEGENPRIAIESSNKEEIQWWNDLMGIYANSIMESGETSDVDDWETSPNFGPTHYFHSIRHPYIFSFKSWYDDDDDSFVVPDDIFPLTKLQRRVLFATHGTRCVVEKEGFKVEKKVLLSIGWSGRGPDWWIERLPHGFWTTGNDNQISTKSIEGRRESAKYFQKPPEWAIDRWSWLKEDRITKA